MTGITQEQVDGGILLQDALKSLHMFLGKEGLFGSEFVFLSCGDFDGRTLKKEATLKNIFIPNYLKRWINLKKVFPQHLFDKCEPIYDFSSPQTIKKANAITKGMTDMLDTCGIKLEGRHHSGIDDAKNIAAIVIDCLKRGYTFTQGMVFNSN